MSNSTSPRSRRLAAVVAACACAALTIPAAASAETPIDPDGTATAVTTWASRQECSAPTLFQPFASWKDSRHYVLAPGGSFDDPSGGGWQLGGGAAIVQEDDTDGDTNGVLDMPTGSVAVSPTMCVDLDYPTARMWVRNVEGDGDIKVAVMYDAGKTSRMPQSVGHVHGAKAGWRLSGDLKIQPQLAGKEAGWRRVAFVLQAGGKDSLFRLDDFYVDPRMVR
jgi:hypothetical protein